MQTSITDPAVTLTDYALAIECATIVILLARAEATDKELRFWFVAFFAAASVASLLGGTVHGFFKNPASAGHAVLWPATLLSILASGLAAWFAATRLQMSEPSRAMAQRAAAAGIVLLAFVAIFVKQKFYVAIIGYLPATLFLLGAFVVAYNRRPARRIGWGIFGLSLTLIAAGIQRLGIAIHPRYFDHNALYHVVQGVALWMIFVAARYLSTAQPPIRRTDAVTT